MKRLPYHHQDLGFSLPEMVLILFLLGLFAAFAMPNFLTWVNNKRVEDVLGLVEGAVKEAQAEAIQSSQICNVTITATAVTATPPTCLPTGPRDLTQVSGGTGDSGVKVIADNTAPILFSPKGTTLSSNIFVFYHPQQAQGMRCLAISEGLGLLRTGKFMGPHTPQAGDATANNCHTSS